MSASISELLVIWKDPFTRLRHIVGILQRINDVYYFYYDDDGLVEAEKAGFNLFPSFPDRKIKYRGDQLFPLFKQRLPDSNRPDFLNIARRHGITESTDQFDILSRTKGRSATDTIEVVPPTTWRKNGEYTLTATFDIAGWRYFDGPRHLDVLCEELLPGSQITLAPEHENQYDPHAVLVFSPNGYRLGYVPAYYSRDIDCVITQGQYNAIVEKFTPEADFQECLTIRFTGKMRESKLTDL